MEIIDYRGEFDKSLVELSYRSLFHQKEKFEYVRFPPNWTDRYNRSDESIQKLMISDDNVIASLGLIIRNGIVGGKKVKIGCFVDNCILPEYRDKYDDYFRELFTEIEKEALKKNVSVIQGWDFLKHVEHHSAMFKGMDYTWVEGVNWFPGGSYPFGLYPSEIWRLLFWLYGSYFKFFSIRIPKLPGGISLRNMGEDDYDNIVEFLKEKDVEFDSEYSVGSFKDIINRNDICGIVAEKQNEIVGVLTSIVSAWSGWMFGKPHYHEKWKHFFSYTPDEFVVKEEYQNSSLPARMLIELMNLKNPADMIKHKHLNFLVDVFDRRIEWRRKAYESLGFAEPKFDYGCILAKSLDKSIEIDNYKPWHLPSRCVLAPVPIDHLRSK